MTARAKKGTVGIYVRGNRLFIRFPRQVFGGRLVQKGLGLPNTEQGWAEAERRANIIQNAIDLGTFDPEQLDKYLNPYFKPEYLKKLESILPSCKLIDLWGKYLKYKKTTIKETTFRYLNTLTPYLKRCNIDSPYKALEIREWLLENTTESMTKRIIINLNAMFNWGLKHNLVKGKNPFSGMANELKHGYEKETKPCAFNPDEKERLLEAFRTNSYYYNFVKFLFLTGCRPSEAVGLQWGQIDKQYRFIVFDRGIVYNFGKNIKTKGSKNNKSRKFPCNEELRNLLMSLKRKADNELVFPNQNGRPIDYNNFRRRVWHKIAKDIKPESTPYSCRDTFISEQLAKGVSAEYIAKWTDNSVAVIENYYFDYTCDIANILPK